MNLKLTFSRFLLFILLICLVCIAISMMGQGLALCYTQYREYFRALFAFLERLRPLLRSTVVLLLWGGCAAAAFFTRIKRPVLSEWLLKVTVCLYAAALPVLIYASRGSTGSIDNYFFLWAIGVWTAALAARTRILPVAAAPLLIIAGKNILDLGTLWNTSTACELTALIAAALAGWFLWQRRGFLVTAYLQRFALCLLGILAIHRLGGGTCIWPEVLFTAAFVLVLWFCYPQKPISLESILLGFLLLVVSTKTFPPESGTLPAACFFFVPMEKFFLNHPGLSTLTGTVLLFVFLGRLYRWRGGARTEWLCYGFALLLFTCWVYRTQAALPRIGDIVNGEVPMPITFPLRLIGMSALIFLVCALIWRRSFSSRSHHLTSPFMEEPLFRSPAPLGEARPRIYYLAAFALEGVILVGSIFY